MWRWLIGRSNASVIVCHDCFSRRFQRRLQLDPLERSDGGAFSFRRADQDICYRLNRGLRMKVKVAWGNVRDATKSGGVVQ
jgi:hypothetical protein